MHQQTFAEATSEQYRKSTRRERFFDEMNCVVPWTELVAVIAGLSQGERSGRPPVGVKRMLRCIACNNGSTCRIRPSKKRCMTHAPCGVKGHPNVPSYGHRNSPP